MLIGVISVRIDKMNPEATCFTVFFAIMPTSCLVFQRVRGSPALAVELKYTPSLNFVANFEAQDY